METVTLARSLNRPLAHRLDRLLTRRVDGLSGRRPNYLAGACALLEKYFRLRRRAIRAEPHFFGPRASEYYRETLRREEEDRVTAVALDKVYGPSPAGSPPRPSVWVERYDCPPKRRRRYCQ